MRRVTRVTHEFVDSAPAQLEPGKLYISTKYRAIIHLCLCGCGEKVLLKLDPDPEFWSFTFDGRTISIHDSVGNVGLPCRSHYFVRQNRVEWLEPFIGIDRDAALGRTHSKQHPEGSAGKGLHRWFHRRRKSQQR